MEDRKSKNEVFLSLDSEEELEEAIKRSQTKPVVLFKHSITCRISKRANHQMERLNKLTDPPVYRLIVQYSRGLSNEIASTFGIKHESPQVIILKDSKSIFTASHYAISTDAIRNAI